jgi:hypothetical protein
MDSSCDRAVGAIDELGDGDLGRVKWLLLKRHARKCKECAGYLGRMETLIEALSEFGSVRAPEDLVDTVMAYLLSSVAPIEDHLVEVEHGRRNMFLVVGAAGLGVTAAVALAIVRWVLGRAPGAATDGDDGLAPIGTA